MGIYGRCSFSVCFPYHTSHPLASLLTYRLWIIMPPTLTHPRFLKAVFVSTCFNAQ